jgi:hypothetical protein
MSTLSGQSISNTYDGLLKLSDSTTGITSTFQAIEDGLGNNTGARIKTDNLTAPNLYNVYRLKADYYGPGWGLGVGVASVAGQQNCLSSILFYDSGVYSYSAISVYTGTITSTSDVVTASLYSAQWVTGIGLAPYELLVSGLTFDVTSTGQKTQVFSTPLSMSGYGGGIFYLVLKIANAGVTPTFRFTSSPTTATNQTLSILIPQYGLAKNVAGNIGGPTSVGINQNFIFPSMSNFVTTFSEADVNGRSSTLSTSAWGFALHTDRA